MAKTKANTMMKKMKEQQKTTELDRQRDSEK